MAHDLAIRQLAYKKYCEGLSISTICEHLDISKATFHAWLHLVDETNSFQRRFSNGRPPAIQDLKKFREFVDKNPARSTQKMADDWNKEFNASVAHDAIRTALQRINYTYKKKQKYMLKGMK